MTDRLVEKPAATAAPIHELLARRWSARAMDPARPVPHATLIALLEAARWAPSGANSQPWRFLVVDRHADPATWQRAFGCLEAGNQEWCADAALLIAAVADTLDRRDQPNRLAAFEAGLATQNLLLECVAQGLVAHAMAGFDGAALRAAFEIPARFEPQAMIAVGPPGDPSRLSEKNRTREAAPRTRRALAEIAFLGSWGRGLA